MSSRGKAARLDFLSMVHAIHACAQRKHEWHAP
jgi:hypothetical protein